MREVTKDEIRAELNKLVAQEVEGVSHSVNYPDLASAIDAEVKRLFTDINEFAELDQEMIDQQEDEYPDMLYGAKVGDLVWGESECWVSQSTVSDWASEANERLNDEYSNDIADLARCVQCDFILSMLNKNQ